MDADEVRVEPGDMLLLHTGFSGVVLSMNRRPDMEILNHSCAALDGRDDGLLQWISESGVAAICSDNYAVRRTRPQNARAPGPLFRSTSTVCSSLECRLASSGG